MKFILFIGLFLVSASLHAQLADFQHTDFHKADSVASAHFGEGVTDLADLSNKLTHSLKTDPEKFRAIYQWVCTNIEFDYELFRLNREKRDRYDSPEALMAWNKKFTPLVFRHLVLEKKTVCTGYAWLVQQLATHAAIPCVIVNGYGRTAKAGNLISGKPNHSWNAVQLNGKWYLCDPTWSSGSYDTDRETYVRNLDLSYFLAEPTVFVRNHYPVDKNWMLLEAQASKLNPTFNEFLTGPLVYSSAYKHNITQLSPGTFDLQTMQGDTINFSFISDKQIENIELAVHGEEVNSFHPVPVKDTTGRYSVNHVFMDKGRHIVHVLLDSSYAFTYTVKVK
jgi:transglutaminase/protease-like cytokinesis protein 3